jgi:signal transduction histidine kinase/CheY-like chemotaxis protein
MVMRNLIKSLLILVLLLTLTSQKSKCSGADTIFYIGDNNYPPFEFVNDEGKADGFNVDLIREIARISNAELVVNLMPWHEVVDSMLHGSRTYVTSMFISDEREKLYLFSTPHNKVSQAMFVPEDSEIKSFEDTKDKNIMVETDDIMHDFVKGIHITGEIQTYPNYTEAIIALEKGKGDVVFCPLIQGVYFLQEHNIKNINYFELPLPPLDYCYSISNGDSAMLTSINEALLIAHNEGVYESVYQKWYSAYKTPGFKIFVKKWLFPAIGAFVLIIILIFLWIYSLRRQVFQKTKALQVELEERKLIDKNLHIAKEKAEESDRLKTAFLANLSHEIRTPMNGIIGFSDLLIQEFPENDPRKEHLEIIHKSSVQLLNIIEDIINMSKIEAGEVKLNSTSFVVKDILIDIQNLHEPMLDSDNINFTLDIPDKSKNLRIKTDEGKLKQVIHNLLSNAAKFTEQGEIRFGFEQKGDYIEFYVEDTGSGIPENQHEKIFRRFVQGDVKMYTPISGTGLGLAIAKAYVEIMGGSIHLDSHSGKGSCFYFSIKPEEISDKSKEKEKEYENAIESLKGKRILVAEDITDNYYYVKELLKRYQVTCQHAKNGQEAVDFIKEEAYDAVLMDLKMPVLNGYESFEEIRKLRKDMPIIALTAYAQDNDKQRVLEAGFDDYLAKPVSRKALIRILTHHLT